VGTKAGQQITDEANWFLPMSTRRPMAAPRRHSVRDVCHPGTSRQGKKVLDQSIEGWAEGGTPEGEPDRT
jgi:hypothetical protein